MPLNSIREIQILKQFASHTSSNCSNNRSHRNIIKFIDIVSSKSCEHLESTLTEISLRKDRNDKIMKIEEEDNNNNNNITTTTTAATTASHKYHAYDMSRCGNLYLVFEYVEVMCIYI